MWGLIESRTYYTAMKGFHGVTGDEILVAQSMQDWLDEQIKKMEADGGQTLYVSDQAYLPGFQEPVIVAIEHKCTCSVIKLLQEGCRGTCEVK